MARLRNTKTGVVVNTDDAKVVRLGRGWEPDGGGTTGSDAEGYDALTVDQLKDEIRARNENRDDDARIALTGAKADLVAALEADDK